eukprot:Gb_28154 [translate_table: standard]
MEGKECRSEWSNIGHSENVYEQKYDALADTHGFSPTEIGSLDALCSSIFPSLPFEAKSLRASKQNFIEEVYQFYLASTQVVGLGNTQTIRAIDIEASVVAALHICGNIGACGKIPTDKRVSIHT